jgi:hypothetical protein
LFFEHFQYTNEYIAGYHYIGIRPSSWCYAKIIQGGIKLIELEYSLVIEATEEPDYFGFYPG